MDFPAGYSKRKWLRFILYFTSIIDYYVRFLDAVQELNYTQLSRDCFLIHTNMRLPKKKRLKRLETCIWSLKKIFHNFFESQSTQSLFLNSVFRLSLPINVAECILKCKYDIDLFLISHKMNHCHFFLIFTNFVTSEKIPSLIFF